MINNLLISVRPKFATRIMSGEKTVELRRLRPRVSPGDNLLFYISSPDKRLGAISKIKKITTAPLDTLWEEVRDSASLTYDEFMDYFKGVETGYAIYFSKFQKFHTPIKLDNIRKLIPGFTAPQSYRYFSPKELSILMSQVAYLKKIKI